MIPVVKKLIQVFKDMFMIFVHGELLLKEEAAKKKECCACDCACNVPAQEEIK